MSDSKVEVKACRKCGGTARYREDGLWFVECSVCGEYEGPHARKVEAKKMWNIKNTIANNGVSCEDILELMLVDDLKESGHAACSATYKRTYFNWCRPMVEKVLAKLPTTAPRGGDPLNILKRIIKATPHSMCSDAEAWAIAEQLITEGDVIGG